MTIIEQEIIAELTQMDTEQQQRVLDYVRSLKHLPQKSAYTARELLQLPTETRQRIISEAFHVATKEDFETFEA